MKYFYFVRHGESKANVIGAPDNGSSPLTEGGREQSAYLAERFASIPLDIILASPYVRTKQTAEIFNRKLKKPIEFSPLITEKRYPSQVDGQPPTTSIWQEIIPLTREQQHESGWHYSDEENFEDLKQRGQDALAFLQERSETRIAVITHGGFLRMLMALMLHGENLTSHEFIQVIDFFRTTNTGITLCEYNKDAKERVWRLVTWMDHAHLGDA